MTMQVSGDSSSNSRTLIQSLDAFRAHTAAAYKLQSYELVPMNAARILDVGSGTGDDVLALAERCGTVTFLLGL